MSGLVVDLYAGAGGWDEGAQSAGITRTVGLDNWLDACRTAVAAGYARVCADVATYPTAPFVGRTWGLLGSPPCQAWSLAGKRLGKLDQTRVHTLVERFARYDQSAEHAWMEAGWADARTHHAAQPVRWIRDLRPEWVCLEQVPDVLPLWRHTGRIITAWGYRVWTGLLDAANYGTPQNRERAILIASRIRSVSQPPATHYDARLGGSLVGGEPWVTIGEALGWASFDRPARTVSGNRAPRWAYGVGNSYNTGWTLVGGAEANATVRTLDEPAATVFCSRPGNLRWRPRSSAHAPATCAGGHEAEPPRLAVSVDEAAILQGFRPDYPWRGNKTSRFHQVGNAVPPQLAAACVAMAAGMRVEGVAA